MHDQKHFWPEKRLSVRRLVEKQGQRASPQEALQKARGSLYISLCMSREPTWRLVLSQKPIGKFIESGTLSAQGIWKDNNDIVVFENSFNNIQQHMTKLIERWAQHNGNIIKWAIVV